MGTQLMQFILGSLVPTIDKAATSEYWQSAQQQDIPQCHLKGNHR